MSRLKALSKESIQTREVTVSTCRAGENSIIIEGIIKDSSNVPFYKLNGERFPSKTSYHHMIVRWLVQCSPLQIVDLEIEMPEVPMAECLETKKMIKSIKGIEISGSFVNKINDLFGGTKGWAHVKSLLLLMGSTALQGYVLLNSRDTKSLENTMTSIVNSAKNTCYVWRESGDLYKTYGT